AVVHLIQQLDATSVAGTLILVPLVNTPSFDQKVPHVNQIDKKSMNRFYPGKPDGTQTDRASYAMTKQSDDRCDHLIDLEGGAREVVADGVRPGAYASAASHDEVGVESRKLPRPLGFDKFNIMREAAYVTLAWPPGANDAE